MLILNMSTFGKCMTMCPNNEVIFRKKHNLLHVLEFSDLQGISKKLETADKCVKEFHRSAAGETVSNVESLRPSKILLETTKYLLEVVLQQDQFSFVVKYDFIFNRLRSVRQDATIQRLAEFDPNTQITLLERCVRFYIFAIYQQRLDYRLKIDMHINRTHMNDCLKSLLKLYIFNISESPMEYIGDCCSVTAAYILLNLNSPEIVFAVLKCYPKSLRASPEISCAIKMYFSYQNNNFVSFNKLILKLIKRRLYLPVFALSTCIDEIRVSVMVMLSHSHNSKQLSFSCDDLLCWLSLNSTKDVLNFCCDLGVQVVNNDSVKLSKMFISPKTNPRQLGGCHVFEALHDLESEDLCNYFLHG